MFQLSLPAKRALILIAAVTCVVLSGLNVFGMIVSQTIKIMACVKALAFGCALIYLHDRWMALKS